MTTTCTNVWKSLTWTFAGGLTLTTSMRRITSLIIVEYWVLCIENGVMLQYDIGVTLFFSFIYDYITDKITSLSYSFIRIALCHPPFLCFHLISRNYGPFPNIRIAYHCLGSLLVIVPLLRFMTHPSYRSSGP